MATPFSAYHGVNAGQHQQHFNHLSKQGYRMIALSVYGGAGDPRYAAVWVKRPGPEYVATHGISAAQYQSFFDTWSGKGFVPALITATGSGSNAVFAAVFEKHNYPAWVARHHIDEATFNNENKQARKNNLRLKSVTVYGSGSGRRYAGVWIPNPSFIKWLVYPNVPAANYQGMFNANTELPYYKPEIVALSEDAVYCPVFTDSIVGRWVAKHGLTADAYQAAFDKYTKEGLMPIYVDGGGTGSGTRYACVFAESDVPQSRKWAVTGTQTTATKALDQVMKTFMQKHAIRYAQLCLGKNGNVKYNRAFTWAEANYKTAQPSDRFLLASCSKMFLCAAIQALFDSKDLAPGDVAYAKLGFSNPKDTRSDDITIQHLLDHKGGFDAKDFDATYSMRFIAKEQGLAVPVTKHDLAKYMYKKRDLIDDPGARDNYSNYGYVLLSLIIEKVTGKDYFQYLKQQVLDKIGVSEVKIWKTMANPRPADEVATESWGLGESALVINTAVLVPNVYGGDGMIKEVAAASCGLASSARAMVQFIHQRAVWGTGGRMANSARSGGTPGASTLAVSRGDGIDWAYTLNTRDFVKPPEDPLKELGDAINDFLAANAGTI
ncbi:serine hydrolase [Niabella hirudinis]|uniref:serine hydrolase n=1 Tax=Niabella hirudinis TaxID=1285929 RepID=UPI003EBDFCDB